LVPQVVAPASAHWVATAGAWPAGMDEQVPLLAVSAHDWQVPVQALAQQTPWAQNPELQSVAPVQTAPIGFFEQALPMQK
jgi:hypothetical protein